MAMLGDTPCEPTVSRRWKKGLVQAIRVGVVRTTAKTGRAVCLRARRIAYGYVT